MKTATTMEAETNPNGSRRRGGRRRRGNRSSGAAATKGTSTKFKGLCPELEGQIFDTGPSQAAAFVRTKTAIESYAWRTYSPEVGKAIKLSRGMKHLYIEPQDPIPAGRDGELSFAQKEMVRYQARTYLMKIDKYASDMRKLYGIIFDQCTDQLKQQIETDAEFGMAALISDPIKLMNIIQKVCYNYRSEMYPPLAAIRAMKALYFTKQAEGVTNTEWLEQFRSLVRAADACGASITLPGVTKYVKDVHYPNTDFANLKQIEQTTVKDAERAVALTTLYLENADSTRYGQLKKKLENNFLMKQRNYPQTVAEAQTLLNGFRAETNKTHPHQGSGLAFAQGGAEGSDYSKMTCWKCGKKGHLSWEGKCKQEDIDAHQAAKQKTNGTEDTEGHLHTTDGETEQQETPEDTQSADACLHFAIGTDIGADSIEEDLYAPMFMNCTVGKAGAPFIDYDSTVLSQTKERINPDWILLDNQSTVNVFCNAKLLGNIRQVKQYMYIYCNAGVTKTNWIGDLQGIGAVWFHRNGIANILSLSKVKRTNRITFDSHNGNVFRLHDKDQTSFREFKESENGLYYSHMKQGAVVLNSIGVGTVTANEATYSSLDRRRAKQARKFQDILNLPTAELTRLIDAGNIPNCPITREDLKTADSIYGRSIIGLKGKTVRRPEEHVRIEIKSLPPDITEKYMNVALSADIMYVNGIRFFVTISRHIQFATAEAIGDADTNTLLASIKKVVKTYRKREFTIETISMDNQFNPLRGSIEGWGITVNFVSRDEHVPEIERFIRTLKERARGVQSSVPFKKFPALLTRGMVESQLFWWNAVQKASGVSATMSPRCIVTGMTIDYVKHCRLLFGEYVQTHEETNNATGHERTIGALALRPTGNQQGGHYFFSLRSGRIINRNHWTPLPMPNEVIQRIHQLARRQGSGLVFKDRNGTVIADDEDDDSGSTDDSSYAPDSDDDTDSYASDSDNSYASGDITHCDSTDSAGVPSTGVPSAGVPSTGVPSTNGSTVIAGSDTTDNTGVNNDTVQNRIATRKTRRMNRAPRRATRPPRKRSYKHLKTVGYINNVNGINRQARLKQSITMRALQNYSHPQRDRRQDQVNHVIMTQYGVKKGLKLFGSRGTAAVKKELQQVHDRKVVKPVHPQELTREQRVRALAYLMFLKEKRTGEIKGRGCADGRKQRDWMNKEDTTSPTVSTQALILSCMIDAKENRDVATADIPGAFLQTHDKTGSTHLRLEGPMVDILVEIDPDTYKPYVYADKRGRKYMYAECLKAIYGTLNAALMFWLKLSGDLERWGFIQNPYDWCVMNKIINGKQCTILWHVDDLKISHVDAEVVTGVLKQINDEYGAEGEITSTRGKIHDYLGMTLDFSTPGTVQITMIDYIHAMLDELPEELKKGVAVTPAADHLFKVNNDNPELLNKEDKDVFHRNTAKLLFLSKRARPDIQLPVAFLCTRVQKPDVNDWRKLHRVMIYLEGSIGIPLKLAIDDNGSMRWFVDAAFAVHVDMHSHTGMSMSMGSGSPISSSRKQKLVTRSSTEAELVGVDDEMSQILWCRYFLLAQGVSLKDNILYQDNQASMRLEMNGKRSSGQRTRHINIRYFFITDRIEKGEISVEHCPTLDMVGDYFTKPLQGSHFRRLRNTIMGIEEVDIPGYNSKARALLTKRKEQRDDLANPKDG